MLHSRSHALRSSLIPEGLRRKTGRYPDLPGFTTAMDGGSAGAAGSGSSKNLEGPTRNVFDNYRHIIIRQTFRTGLQTPSSPDERTARERGTYINVFTERDGSCTPVPAVFDNYRHIIIRQTFRPGLQTPASPDERTARERGTYINVFTGG